MMRRSGKAVATSSSDAAAIWLATYLFVELCPAEVVREHQDSLTSVIEGRFREVADDEPPKQP